MIGEGLGALGFLAGPIVSGITMSVGTAVGGALGHMASREEQDNNTPQWAVMILAANTTVYNKTAAMHAVSIIQGGIQPVANAFGGGQLGQGYYTYTDPTSAEL